MNKKKYISALSMLAIILGVGLATTTNAQTTGTTSLTQNPMSGIMHSRMKGHVMGQRGIIGTVNTINGTTITITSTRGSTTTTYTVDASNAKIMKGGQSSTVSSIVIGDKIMVMGQANGTNVTATMINDGPMKFGDSQNHMMPQNIPAGNGEPIVGGTVSSISGNTITITNQANVTYTVDATNAKISKAGATSPTISNISTGDAVVIQGTINGNSVTASSVIDNGTQTTNTTTPNNQTPAQAHPGVFGGIGGFFKHLFGF